MLPGLVLFLNMRTIALNLLPVRFSGASGYSWRSCVPAARSWRCSFFLRTIRLLVPLQSEALVERFAVQLKEDLELVTSFAQNTQSYHHLRRTCLGLRVTRGSLGSRVAQSGAVWQFSPSGPEKVVLGGFSTRLAWSYPWWWSLGLSSICSPTLLSVRLLPSMHWHFTVLKSSHPSRKWPTSSWPLMLKSVGPAPSLISTIYSWPTHSTDTVLASGWWRLTLIWARGCFSPWPGATELCGHPASVLIFLPAKEKERQLDPALRLGRSRALGECTSRYFSVQLR